MDGTGEEEDLSFEDMGLDARLIRTLAKKNITKPTPIQLKAIPLILRTAIVGPPDIVVATPSCIATCIAKKVLHVSSVKDSLSTLVLDEADLLLSYGYEDDLKSLVPHIPSRCQCLLMSATTSADVEKIKKLVLHSPVVLTLTEVEGSLDNEIVPKSVQQFWIACEERDKLLYILSLLKLELVQKKVLIFVNSIDAGFKLKLFLEQFGMKSAVFNAELPQNSRLHMLEEFNTGMFDYMIATDGSKPAKVEKEPIEQVMHPIKRSKKHQKRVLDSEYGVVRGIDFKNVHTVINFDMPLSALGYIHRIGRTGRAYNTGASVSLVSPAEEGIFREIKMALSGGKDEDIESVKFIAPFPLLTNNAVESLRYRAQDVAHSVTKAAVREARANELRNELLNSERLKSHFEDNPKDLDLLKHDKVLSKKQPSSHLCAIPDYLVDPTTEAASKVVKLARGAMGQNKHRSSGWLKKGSGRSADPLKTFLIDSKKGSWKGRSKKRMKEQVNDRERPKKKHKWNK
ncbi:DEAD-box ATP-dependent RNA helicase 16 isoform X2 [Cryptomeria japonica]|uniref:DEAD-box ATP-dependent RNA helicase 16 isoform X2 n=1 Tax=Cryptomeria japonica TaxID=3369 RepID=UPI0027D9E682|nr:DEAD-box ATP-dependent RNA helicase 16 isoform X2 [Cryptomeria japonica]